MRKWTKPLLILVLAAALVGWFLSAPKYVNSDLYADLQVDATAGEAVFYAGGCSSCHAAPNAKGDEKYILAGGKEFKTPFGTFIAPNISPSDQGIGAWSALDLANAMQTGVSPQGQHYYPAFPYASYVRMAPQDIVDLHAYMQTLPKSETPTVAHDVGFPFNIRRGLGLWKLVFVRSDNIADIDQTDPVLARGQYLAEGAGHCAECHTPRNFVGGFKYKKWMAGGPNPDGPGSIPNITGHSLSWSAEEIAEYLNSGFTPDFDSVGGSMVDVQENMAKLSAEDRTAIAAYLKILPSIEGDAQ